MHGFLQRRSRKSGWRPSGRLGWGGRSGHGDHGDDEEHREGPVEGLFSWLVVDGEETLVFDFDSCDKKLLQTGARAGQAVRSDFTKSNVNAITTDLKEVSGTPSDSSEPDLLHRCIDFKIGDRTLRASALGRRDQELRRRALGVAMCLAAAVHSHMLFAGAPATYLPVEFQRVVQHLRTWARK